MATDDRGNVREPKRRSISKPVIAWFKRQFRSRGYHLELVFLDVDDGYAVHLVGNVHDVDHGILAYGKTPETARQNARELLLELADETTRLL